MCILGIAACLLGLSSLLVFGLPMVAFGPRAFLRSLTDHTDLKFMGGALMSAGMCLFLVSGSLIQSERAGVISAQNFYTLSPEV